MIPTNQDHLDDLDIAVIGLAGRFPGAASLDQFWANLAAGVESICPLTEDELRRSGVPATEYGKPEYVRAASVLADVDMFDAAFFGDSPKEAEMLDPQVRVLLECAWEAFEDAGYDPLRNAVPVGVFAASSFNTYLLTSLRERFQPNRFVLSDGSLQPFLANAQDFLTTRVSYKLNLKGPSVNVQSACSGSLVAVHLACQSLRSGECQMALAAAVSIFLPQHVGYLHRDGLILSPDGHCRPFDAQAAGTVFGRGAGVVVLKGLADALADGDRIYAVIKGSAVNNDGQAKVGYTAPSVTGQGDVIAEAMANAGVTPDTISYIEAHGTATKQGDPIEVSGLTRAFRAGTSRTQFCALGAVKGNIGHLDAAAGMAGLIKTILALDRRMLPPTLHYTAPNPSIDFERSPFYVNTRLTEWISRPGVPRRAGVSAFGMGGTNAHVIVEEAPAGGGEAGGAGGGVQVVTVSGKSDAALRAVAGRLGPVVRAAGDAGLGAVSGTANTGRAQWAHRAAVVGATAGEVAAGLEAVAGGGAPASGGRGVARGSERVQVAWLFTGQGAQYPGMGQGLYATEPVFRAALDACAAGVGEALEVPLLEVLYGGAGARLTETAYAQPAVFAVEYALAALWTAWGVRPAVVLGHSVGEYAAACVAGVLELEAALQLVVARGRLMQALPGGGAMAAVLAPEAVVARWLGPGVTVAAVNGPAAVVVAGPAAGVAGVCAAAAAGGWGTQPLGVSHAFHTAAMDPMLEAWGAVAGAVRYGTARVLVVSSVTGRVAGPEVGTAGYWRRQVREPVQFAAGLATVLATGCEACVEVGPHPTLIGLGRQQAPAGRPLWGASLERGQADARVMRTTLAALWTRGAAVDWAGVHGATPRRTVALPTYPFQRTRFWIDDDREPADGAVGERHVRQEIPSDRLQGRWLASPVLRDRVFECDVAANSPAYLSDHRIGGTVVFPMTGYVELALAAAAAASETIEIESLAFEQAMRIEESAHRTVQLIVGPWIDERAAGRIVSRSDIGAVEATWLQHASLTLRRVRGDVSSDTPALLDLSQIQRRCGDEMSGGDYYERLRSDGLEYGPAFRAIDTIWTGPAEALARVSRRVTTPGDDPGHQLHPALLDACAQTMYAALSPGHGSTGALLVPIALGRVARSGSLIDAHFSHVRLADGTDPSAPRITATITVTDGNGRVLVRLHDLTLQRTSKRMFESAEAAASRDWYYGVRWTPLTRQTRMNGALAEVRERFGLRVYDALEPRLHDLSTDYVKTALRELGWAPTVGERFTMDAIADTLEVRPRHRRMLGRMFGMLAEDGVLRQDGETWETIHLPSPAGRDNADALLRAYPECRAELTLVARCGGHLAAVLRGTRDPLELLFPSGSIEDLEALYRHAPYSQATNALVVDALGELLAAWPENRPIRVLEIGAGTGGTASAVLPTLPQGRTEYVFTDVSPLFGARAKERFSGFPFVRYQTLDIERDPVSQGFEGRLFDIVLATNVLHATVDLRRTVGYVRDLLAPGGAALIVETVAPQRWVDVIFGLTDGWWRFGDTALRPVYPTIATPQWKVILRDLGLDEPTIVPGDDAPDALFHQAVIVARRPAASQADAPGDVGALSRVHWLVFADAGGTGDALCAAVEARGERCTLVRRASVGDAGTADVRLDPAKPEHFRRLLGDVAVPVDVQPRVVYLWGLDAPTDVDLSDGELMPSQSAATGGALHLSQALLASDRWRSAPATLVTRGAQPVAGTDVTTPTASPLWGFGRVVAIEHPELRCRRIDLDPAEPVDVQALLTALDSDSSEDEVALRSGTWYGARLTRLEASELAAVSEATVSSAARLEVDVVGALDSLSLHSSSRRAPGAGEVEIAVDLAGLNFKDVLRAMGVIRSHGALGLECAGRITRVGAGVSGLQEGDAVVAMAPGSLSTYVTTPAHYVVPKPATLSMEEAATIPVAFLTAHYALISVARLEAGDRVLIHAATGGVGTAALELARHAGAEVFATAGSDAKRQWLRDSGVAHVMDSRSLRFAEDIRASTDGRGVDVVLNSLAGEHARASLSVLAPGGRFIELGKSAWWSPEEIARQRPDVSFTAIDLSEAFDQAPAEFLSVLSTLVRACGDGTLTALPWKRFAASDAIDAFRTMQQARHTGKLLIAFDGARHASPSALPLRADATYVVTGAYGGLGRLTSRWLVEKGARNLALIGRRPPSPEAAAELEAMRAHGVRVADLQGDVANPHDVHELLDSSARSMPPVRGVIHAAGSVDDRVLVQQDWDRFARVFAAKVQGSWNLHLQTRELPLDFFVLFSTVVSLLGSAGQSNHAAANAFMDGLASYRRRHRLPALSINWGPWSEIGAAVNLGVAQRLASQGFDSIAPREGMAALETLMGGGVGRPQVGVMPMTWPTYFKQFPTRAVPRLSELKVAHAKERPSLEPPSEPLTAAARRDEDGVAGVTMAAVSDRKRLLVRFLSERIARSLGLSADEPIELHRPLEQLGLDSLLAVEVRSVLGTAIGVSLPATLLFDYPTLDKVTDYLGRHVLAVDPWLEPAASANDASAASSADPLTLVEDLDDEAVERLLADKLSRT